MASSSSYSHHFSHHNIPFGIASSKSHHVPQAVTRIGDAVIFLADLASHGLFSQVNGFSSDIFSRPSLNAFAALGGPVVGDVRRRIQDLLSDGGLEVFPVGSVEDFAEITMHLPIEVADFTDFSCSLEHVKNAGRIILKDDRPPPGFFHFPIAYQGRASSVVVSGTPIERPMGHYRDKTAHDQPVVFGPSRQMDYELEFAAVVGKPLGMRKRLRATGADDHIFGFVILNDWSAGKARDIQAFEMMPLGPCNGKNLGTTISPWVVTLDALEPFRVPGPARTAPVQHHLEDPGNNSYAVRMQVEILAGSATTVTGISHVESLYWNTRQMAAHIASAGSALRPGDILATGTVSGAETGSSGCLLEATQGGVAPIRLSDGSTRAFLEDGDVVRMTAVAGDSGSGVGWGGCTGQLLPARPF